MASDILAVVMPAMAFVAVYSRNALPKSQTIKTLTLFLAAACAYVLIDKLSIDHPSKAYSMELELVWLRKNVSHISAYVFSHWGVAIFAVLAFLGITASLASRQRSPVGLMTMSIVCALPFLFLVFAHDVYYHGLSFPFFIAAVLKAICLLVEKLGPEANQTRVSAYALTLFVVVFFAQSFQHYADYYRFPRGRSHVKLAKAIEALDLRDTIICTYRTKHLEYIENPKLDKLRYTGNYILDYFNRNGNKIVNGTLYPDGLAGKPNTVDLALEKFKHCSYKFQFYKDGQPLEVER